MICPGFRPGGSGFRDSGPKFRGVSETRLDMGGFVENGIDDRWLFFVPIYTYTGGKCPIPERIPETFIDVCPGIPESCPERSDQGFSGVNDLRNGLRKFRPAGGG